MPPAPPLARTRWWSPERGDWEAGRGSRRIGSVRRERGVYVATTSRGRAVGEFDTLTEAQSALGRGLWDAIEPAQAWTALLAAVNVAMIASIAVIATTILA